MKYHFTLSQDGLAAAINRPGGVLTRLSGMVNNKFFKLVLVILLTVAIIGYMLSSRGSGDRQQVSYVTVHVKAGDTVWQIAARHVLVTEDIRKKVFAIRQANKLNNNADIYPGQVLKVPVDGPAD